MDRLGSVVNQPPSAIVSVQIKSAFWNEETQGVGLRERALRVGRAGDPDRICKTPR